MIDWEVKSGVWKTGYGAERETPAVTTLWRTRNCLVCLVHSASRPKAAFTRDRNAVQDNARRQCMLIYARKLMADDNNGCNWNAAGAQIALFIMYASDGRMLTAKWHLFKLVITSHFSSHVQIWPRAQWTMSNCGILRHVAEKTMENVGRAPHNAARGTGSGVNAA